MNSIKIDDTSLSSDDRIELYQIDNQKLEESLHRHRSDEILLITRGSGVYQIGGHQGPFQPGLVAYIRSGVDHCWKSEEADGRVSAMQLHVPIKALPSSILALREGKGVKGFLEGVGWGAVGWFPEHDRIRARLGTIAGARGFLKIARVYALYDLISSLEGWQVIEDKLVRKIELRDQARLKTIREYVESRFPQRLSRDEAAVLVGMEPSAFSRFFHRASGQKFNDYVNVIRVREAAKKLVARRQTAIARIAMECGFANQTVFNRQFRKRLGTTPRDYRRQMELEPVAP